MLTLKNSFMLSVIAVAAIAIFLPGCEEDTTSPGNYFEGKGKELLELMGVPTLGVHDHHFHTSRTKLDLNNTESPDPFISQATVNQPWYATAIAYFDDGASTVSSITLNSAPYTSSATGGITQYQLDNAPFFTNGSNNVFNWTKGGTPYSHSWSTNIGDVVITSPAFNTSVSKSGALTVTWSAAPFGGPTRYCKVEIYGKLSTSAPTGSTGHYASSGYIDDFGTYTFPAGTFSSWTENSATIAVSAGTYDEQTFGGQTYLFTAFTEHILDVDLVP